MREERDVDTGGPTGPRDAAPTTTTKRATWRAPSAGDNSPANDESIRTLGVRGGVHRRRRVRTGERRRAAAGVRRADDPERDRRANPFADGGARWSAEPDPDPLAVAPAGAAELAVAAHHTGRSERGRSDVRH